MDVKLVYEDGEVSSQFECSQAYTVNDVAYLDSIMHTDVQQMIVSDA
jgi:hypothetical protein